MSINEIMQHLVHPDENTRRPAIEYVRSGVEPSFLDSIIDELIREIHAANQPENAYAQAAIIGLGRVAIKPLSFRLINSQDVRLQLKLVSLLTEIGLSVAPEDGGDILLGLVVAANTSESDDVVESCMQGIVRMRWPDASADKVREDARFARMSLVRSGMEQFAQGQMNQ
jgi:hypothetical protein